MPDPTAQQSFNTADSAVGTHITAFRRRIFTHITSASAAGGFRVILLLNQKERRLAEVAKNALVNMGYTVSFERFGDIVRMKISWDLNTPGYGE